MAIGELTKQICMRERMTFKNKIRKNEEQIVELLKQIETLESQNEQWLAEETALAVDIPEPTPPEEP